MLRKTNRHVGGFRRCRGCRRLSFFGPMDDNFTPNRIRAVPTSCGKRVRTSEKRDRTSSFVDGLASLDGLSICGWTGGCIKYVLHHLCRCIDDNMTSREGFDSPNIFSSAISKSSRRAVIRGRKLWMYRLKLHDTSIHTRTQKHDRSPNSLRRSPRSSPPRYSGSLQQDVQETTSR